MLDYETRQFIRVERSKVVLARAKREMNLMRNHFESGSINSVPEVNKSANAHAKWKAKKLLERTGLARMSDGNLQCIDCSRISHPHANHNGKGGGSTRHYLGCSRLKVEQKVA